MAKSLIPAQLAQRAVELAERAPTPFYLFDLDGIASAFTAQAAAWRRYFPRFRSAYSYKTNPLRAITRLLGRHGASAEVVSGAELGWAIEDGFAPADILFDGPVKAEPELRRALALGVRIQVDSLDEIDTLVRLCRAGALAPALSVRLAVERGDTVSRFGMIDAEYQEAARRLAQAGLRFRGVHVHVGSNQNEPARYARAVAACVPVLRTLQEGGGAIWLDVGGGFPARSLHENAVLAPSEAFAAAVAEELERHGLARDGLELVIEPGRSLVEDFAILATRVMVRKQRAGRRILVVDAGTNLVRSVHAWHHPIEFARRAGAVLVPYELYGALCFESDAFAAELYGPRSVEVGELVLVGSAGGYDVPSANVWTRPAPAMFGRLDGETIELRRAQAEHEVRRLDV